MFHVFCVVYEWFMSMAHVSRKMDLLAGLKTECNMLVVDKKV